MSDDDPSDTQIALLCSLGERDPSPDSLGRRGDLAWLIAHGYAERTCDSPGLKLTAKGANYLSERGAGLNEA